MRPLARFADGPAAAAGVARALFIERTGRCRPRVEGALRFDGLDHRIEIIRDRHGVPHVFAQTERDAIFGQGFVHAQDRLFQVDLLRRVAAGRLSEVFGTRTIESDRFMRRLGLARIALQNLESASDEERALLDAYARGFNAGGPTLRTLPPEYAAIRARPNPWRPEHTLLIGRVLMFSFATNWDTELLRERLVRELGPDLAATVDPAYGSSAPTTTGSPIDGAADRLLDAYHAAVEAGLPSGGLSNAWALAGSQTRSGQPLLAADPHLLARLPGLFHVCHVSGGGFDFVGAGVPGLPGAMLGHNRDVAWGVTAALADVSDCYVETVDADDPARYRTPDGWARGTLRTERINIRGGRPLDEVMLETRHGPVIGPAIDDENRAISLRSSTLDPGETVGPLLEACRASSAGAFGDAIARWPGATFNFVFADREGHIGYRLAGSPLDHEHGEGLLPHDGSTSAGPRAAHAAGQLPYLTDPDSGIVISANEAPGGPLELGEEWCEPWRATRIAELLGGDAHTRSGVGHTVATQCGIQLDLHSDPLALLRDLLVESVQLDDNEVSGLLRTWDGQTHPESAAAGIMETIYQHLARSLVARVAGSASATILGEGIGGQASHSSFHYRLQGPLIEALRAAAAPWCDGIADRDRMLGTAAKGVLAELRSQLGGRPADWSWGRLHRLHLDHPLHAIPVIGKRFSRGPFPVGGDVNTIWQGGYTVHDGPRGTTGFSPAYRQVLDLADWDASRFQLPAGNSGIPGHPRYNDCTVEFLEGRYRPLRFSREVVELEAEHRLTLNPA